MYDGEIDSLTGVFKKITLPIKIEKGVRQFEKYPRLDAGWFQNRRRAMYQQICGVTCPPIFEEPADAALPTSSSDSSESSWSPEASFVLPVNQMCMLCVGYKLKYLRLCDLEHDIQQALRSINYTDPAAVEDCLSELASRRTSAEWEKNLELLRIIRHIQSKCIDFKSFQKLLGLGRVD